MSTIVIYKTKYGATKKYAEWIAEELNCEVKNVKDVRTLFHAPIPAKNGTLPHFCGKPPRELYSFVV